MSLSDELDAFQTYLEAVRAHPDDDELWEDLAKAKAAVEVAYLEEQFQVLPEEKGLFVTITFSAGALGPFMKAITPALLSLVAAGVNTLVTGRIDQQTLVIAITGLGAALVTYLVPNTPKATPPAK